MHAYFPFLIPLHVPTPTTVKNPHYIKPQFWFFPSVKWLLRYFGHAYLWLQIYLNILDAKPLCNSWECILFDCKFWENMYFFTASINWVYAAMNGSEKSNNIALTEGQNLSVRKKYYIFLVHFLKLFLKQFSSELVQHITSYFLLASDWNG